MKLGFVSAILPDLSLDEVVQFAAETDFTCCRADVLAPEQGGNDGMPASLTWMSPTLLPPTSKGPNKLLPMRASRSAGWDITQILSHPTARKLRSRSEHIKKVIQATQQLGLNQMNTFIGRDWSKSVDDNWPRFLDTWRPIIQLAEDHGVRVGDRELSDAGFRLTNGLVGRIWQPAQRSGRRMFEDIPSSSFGLNYDPSHMVWQHMDYIQPIHDFSDRLFHVHAKDVRIDAHRINDVGIMAHPLQFHTPKLPGLGEVDWGRLCSVLSDVGYTGPVCIEVEDRAYEDSLESRKQSRCGRAADTCEISLPIDSDRDVGIRTRPPRNWHRSQSRATSMLASSR